MSTSLGRSRASDSRRFEVTQPGWFWDLLRADGPWEGERKIGGHEFVVRHGIPRSVAHYSPAQEQTEEAFGFKWQQRDTFGSEAALEWSKKWLVERYGDVAHMDCFTQASSSPLLVDAGCGAGMSALELFEDVLGSVHYVGVDISDAVEVAAERFAERGITGGFLQADLTGLPFSEGSVDVIFSEGVLHHTDSTRAALGSLARLLKPDGRILFYVYRKKGPVREFTDDYIRAKLQGLSPEEAWKALEPLTRLGIALGELAVTVDIPEPVDLLGIPAGKIDLQRLFYWHVAKAFYRPDIGFDEMNHINYDWYAPANAARQTPEEVRSWCAEFGLEIEREVVEDSGITVVARKVS